MEVKAVLSQKRDRKEQSLKGPPLFMFGQVSNKWLNLDLFH